MAAFVGNHDCVAIINNYVPKEDVLYFTRKQPLEEKPKLSPELAKPLHDLVMMMNTNPVRLEFLNNIFDEILKALFRVALKFRDNPLLLEKITEIRKVLELMSDREFKNRYDVNEA